MRPRIAAALIALGSLAIPATMAGAAILPVPETTHVQVETGQLGFSQYRVERFLDGSVRTEVHAPAGTWTVVATGVTVAPQVDDTFTLAWPCPSTVADTGSLRMTRNPDLSVTVVQAGSGWSFEFTSRFGRHTVVPAGACGARVVER